MITKYTKIGQIQYNTKKTPAAVQLTGGNTFRQIELRHDDFIDSELIDIMQALTLSFALPRAKNLFEEFSESTTIRLINMARLPLSSRGGKSSPFDNGTKLLVLVSLLV